MRILLRASSKIADKEKRAVVVPAPVLENKTTGMGYCILVLGTGLIIFWKVR
jgi:hypothetical protein